MKQHWLMLALAAVALTMLTGCPEPPKEAPTPPTAAQLAADPSVLPTPRPALEAKPDLSGATLEVNDATLAKMSADAVPSSVTDALASLRGRQFSNAAEFAAAVRGAAGAAAEPFMDRIMRNALVVQLADMPPAPQGEVSIAEREQRMAGAPSAYGVVYFDFDKSNIKPEFESVIKDNAKALMDGSGNVVVEGHCDERGTTEYNLALGQRRAEAVRQALIAAGVPSSRLSTRSFGEERPVALGHDEDSWSKNRRSVLTAK